MVGLDKMKDYTGHIENLEMLANYGEFTVWNKENKDRILKAATAIRELEETKGQLHDIAGQYIIQITALKEQVKEYDEALEKLGSSNGGWLLFYSNPNRPEVLASTFASSERKRIKAMGE